MLINGTVQNGVSANVFSTPLLCKPAHGRPDRVGAAGVVSSTATQSTVWTVRAICAIYPALDGSTFYPLTRALHVVFQKSELVSFFSWRVIDVVHSLPSRFVSFLLLFPCMASAEQDLWHTFGRGLCSMDSSMDRFMDSSMDFCVSPWKVNYGLGRELSLRQAAQILEFLSWSCSLSGSLALNGQCWLKSTRIRSSKMELG